jgi:lipopolysaccharide transport system ATP-binding protein
MSGNTIISLANVGVSFRRHALLRRTEPFWALEDVSFDVRDGETMGVIGRNGAGKSTLLKVLAGILLPDRGKISNSGHRVSLLSLALGFLPHLNGRDNAVLSGMLMGLTRSDVKARLERIIQFAELDEFIDQPVATYSTGMRARLGFAVAIECDPDVVLVDELLGVGDASFRTKSTAAMRTLMQSDKTVVLVSHNPNTLEDLCDRAVWIEDRVTRAEGDVTDVLADYRRALSRRRVKVARQGRPGV